MQLIHFLGVHKGSQSKEKMRDTDPGPKPEFRMRKCVFALSGLVSSASSYGGLGYPSPGNFEQLDCLRQFDRKQGSQK